MNVSEIPQEPKPQPEPTPSLDRKALTDAALDYVEVGLSIIPVSVRTKKPTAEWKVFQGRLPTAGELKSGFTHADGLAIVCGAISDGLELIDFDLKAELFLAWSRLVEEDAPDLLPRLVIEKSQNQGRHVNYRCADVTIPGNDVFARRSVDVSEDVKRLLLDGGVDLDDEASVKKALPSIEVNYCGKGYKPRLVNGKFLIIITLIETRGEGGYFLAYPSPGYELIQGDFLHIPTITPIERQILVNAAIALNEHVDTSKVEGFGYRLPKETCRPGDDFNERGDPAEILTKYKWRAVGAKGVYQHYQRPGKDRGQSASLIDGKWFRVFTTNGFPFEAEKTYSPFAVFALLERDGDFSRAASELAKIGFGNKKTREGDKEKQTHNDKPKPTQAATTIFLPLPPAFPLDVFPAIYQQALREFQEAYAVPMEIPACALLSICGTCIGRTRGVLIKSGWIEHGNLWLAIVGASGIGKSPAVRAIYRPVVETEKKFFAAYQEAYKQYQFELDQRQACSKGERAQLPPLPSPPVWKQLFVDDATTEALTDALAANPRGILWNRDELSGLILDLDKYTGKGGGTKSRLMSAYDSGVWKVNRRDNSKKAFIPHATLSIFGTIQPKALPTIFSNLDAATGFLPRFIFVNAVREMPPLWTDTTVSAGVNQDLANLVESLLRFELDEEGDPQIIGVNREAQAIYHAWFNEKVMAPWRNTEAEIYEAVLAKLRGQALRICLILHGMDAVANHKSELAPVRAATMSKAIRLADYFEIHQRNAWQTIITEGAAATLTPMQRQVVTGILNLESEIRGGLLPTARVTAEINRGGDERFAISVDAVGKAAISLGLTTRHLPDKSGRAIAVEQTDIEKFKNIFRTSVPSVPSVQNADRARINGCNTSVPHVSQVSQADDERGHFGHFPDASPKPGNVDGIRSVDTSDTSDTSLKVISQKTINVHADDLLAGEEIEL